MVEEEHRAFGPRTAEGGRPHIRPFHILHIRLTVLLITTFRSCFRYPFEEPLV